MKQSAINQQKQLKKTKTVGYILAALLAVQPLLDITTDFTKKEAVIKYIIKLLLAAGIAMMGKYTAENLQEGKHKGIKPLENK